MRNISVKCQSPRISNGSQSHNQPSESLKKKVIHSAGAPFVTTFVPASNGPDRVVEAGAIAS